jgi:hypothetical protein
MMAQTVDLKAMARKIKALRADAEALKAMSGGMQAVDRNADRILANVKMLEIDISDVADLLGK